MQIDHCLILAAGFGTRMGKLGQTLPKVLWPVFERSLLELQVAYARSLGISNIYINLHFMGEQIESYCRDRAVFEGIKFLWERPEILDIGGAVHNLASQQEVAYKGRLLILNGDQFFYLKREDLIRHLSPHEDRNCVLFSYLVNSSLGYNALAVDAHRKLKGIIPNKEIGKDTMVETYTGIAMVDLSKMTKVPGKSGFFDSVCSFEETAVPTVLLENIDYWDFGTVQRYWESCFRVLSTYRDHSTHPFLRFLVQERALKTWKIGLQNLSYNARSSWVINLTPDEEIRDLGPAIIMAGKEVTNKKVPCIWWNGTNEEIR